MGKPEGLAAVGRLAIAYSKDLTPETAALYAEKLQDVPSELLEATVNAIIDSARFFPSVSELRVTAARLAGLMPPTQAEAIAIIRKADQRRTVLRRDGSVAYTEREWVWPEDLDDATYDLMRTVLCKVGEPNDAEGKDYFGWAKDFQSAYEVEAEAVTHKALADLSRAQLGGVRRKELTP